MAYIEKWSNQTPSEINDFDKAKKYLSRLRDGNGSPDVFYLGQLYGKESEGRFAARFDSIHTIEVPQKPDLRTAFVEKHRFAKLHVDFQRDLHTRLFQSFATLGFDDISWFSDADLTFVVEMGNAEIKTFQLDIERFNSNIRADGGKGSEIKLIETKIATLTNRIQPYQVELNRRKR